MDSIEKILNFLEEKKDSISPLLILTHYHPDPDAIASAFGLKLLAEKKFNIKTKIAYSGIIGRTENKSLVKILKIPLTDLKPSYFKRYKHFALVDTQPAFDNNPFPSDKKATIVIDQHKAAEKNSADLTVIDTKCGATCVLIAQALLEVEIDIPVPVATAIAYGIISETLNLYRGTNRRVIETYLRILPKSDMSILAKIQNPTRSKRFFKTLGYGIQNASVYNKLVSSNLGFVENPDLVSQITDFLLTYNGMEWAICTGRYKGKLRISLRSTRSDINCGEILREVVQDRTKAGGHGSIAGGSLDVGTGESEETWCNLETKITKRLLKCLKIRSRKKKNYAFRMD